MNELDALFDHIDDVSKRNESALREAQRDDSDANIDGPLEEEEEELLEEEEEEEVEDAEAKLSDGKDRRRAPPTPFLQICCLHHHCLYHHLRCHPTDPSHLYQFAYVVIAIHSRHPAIISLCYPGLLLEG